MNPEFYARVADLSARGVPFATATIVKIDGSASARAGSKAIIQSDGSVQFGWVGGGCVEAMVAREAQAALHDGKTRLLPVDLTDEVAGAGMPCGGQMLVYIEPALAQPHILLLGHGRIAETIATIGHAVGFRITVNGPGATPERFPNAHQCIADDPDFRAIVVTPQTYVVVTTQHKSDDRAIQAALAQHARYIALVASRKRAGIIRAWLLEDGVAEDRLAVIHAPAGLDLGCVTPEEIALSIVAEIVSKVRHGSGRPLREVKSPGSNAPSSPSPCGPEHACAVTPPPAKTPGARA